MKKNICVCIPTYNRPDAVSEVLKRELFFFKKYFIDLIFFDSSDNNDTETIVNKYAIEYPNLFYRRINSDIPSNKKAFMIYKEMAKSEYEYIWMIHDHTVCDENAIKHILKSIKLKGDFYLLKMQARDFAVNRIYDLDEFLIKGAWPLTRFGTAIIRRNTVLQGTNWDFIYQKYLTAKTYNNAHVGYYFERMCELIKPIIYQLDFSRECFFDFMRYQQISWDNEAVRICLECWGSVLTVLPEIYTQKKKALKTQDKWFLSKYSLLEYKKKGIYNLYAFLKYQKWIKLITPENYKNAFWISILPYKTSTYFYCSKLLNKIKEQKKKGRQICLYGAGRHAYECFTYLKNHNVEIDNYLVTDLNGNPNEINGYLVQQADKFLMRNKAFIIIAVLTSGIKEVELYLDELANSGADLEYTRFDE